MCLCCRFAIVVSVVVVVVKPEVIGVSSDQALPGKGLVGSHGENQAGY